MSRRCGLEPAQYDTSTLTDEVSGYGLAAVMTGRTAIEPLSQSFFFDSVESQNKIKFVKRGGSPAVAIDCKTTLEGAQ